MRRQDPNLPKKFGEYVHPRLCNVLGIALESKRLALWCVMLRVVGCCKILGLWIDST
jgi:hypothetical protein